MRCIVGVILAVSLGALGCDPGSVTGDDDDTVGDDGGPADGDGGPISACLCVGCYEQSIGIGADLPFDVDGDPSEFVETDPAGALVVDKRNSKYNRFLWVADTNLPGVVKIDVETFTIVGRYLTGGSSTSRTTVNVLGEAFIGSRSNGSTGAAGVTKIFPDGEGCPDTNGDGVITTSTGPTDVLPWGLDDCVAWHFEAQGDIRGLAAQDIPGIDPDAICQDGGDTPIDTPPQHYVWLGGLHGKIYKVDATTGDLVMQITAPSSVYGMALSGDGKLWTGQGMAFVDTTKCLDQATCEAAPVCSQNCSTSDCSDLCDGAVKATYGGVTGYGITVDCKDRVWMSQGATTRYDPMAPVNMRLAFGPGSGSGGIAADANGWVWASNGSTTTRIDAETLAGVNIGAPNKGVAVDSKGRILTVQNTGVHLIVPGPTLDAYTVTNDVAALEGFAYAYSDMTGVQTRLASDEPGWYRHVFDGCEEGTTDWRNMEWDVETPAGTFTLFNSRSAATLEELEDAEWSPLVTCANGNDCMNLEETGRFLEIEARLTDVVDAGSDTRGCTDEDSVSARIKQIEVRYFCAGIVP